MYCDATCEQQSFSAVCKQQRNLSVWKCITEPGCGQVCFIAFTCLKFNGKFVLLFCFSFVNCLWILNLFMYINICVSHLSWNESVTHTPSVSQPTPGTDKGSFMFAGLQWGQPALVSRASFTMSEWSWRKNEKTPYISKHCGVKSFLLVAISSLVLSSTPIDYALGITTNPFTGLSVSRWMNESLLGAIWIINNMI